MYLLLVCIELHGRHAGSAKKTGIREVRPSLLQRLADPGSTNPNAAIQEQLTQQHGPTGLISSSSSTAELQESLSKCPVCSLQLPRDQLPAHIEKELSGAVEDETKCTYRQPENVQLGDSAQLPAKMQSLSANGLANKRKRNHEPQHDKQKVQPVKETMYICMTTQCARYQKSFSCSDLSVKKKSLQRSLLCYHSKNWLL